jgi:peptidoglycan/xylan/chitin deacetylase (PgdA/CDA1 family)
VRSAPRALLDLFARRGMTTTWFWPGHSVETFPDQFRRCVDAGHEIGVHGYSHENPIAMSREQESAVLDRSIELITRVTDRRPTGTSRPGGSSHGANELLLERGIKYDHSLMHDDFTPTASASGTAGRRSTTRRRPTPG